MVTNKILNSKEKVFSAKVKMSIIRQSDSKSKKHKIATWQLLNIQEAKTEKKDLKIMITPSFGMLDRFSRPILDQKGTLHINSLQ